MSSKGLIYEPRSLWSIARATSSTVAQRVRFNRRHFYNGSRWPIEIRRIATMAVNYVVADDVTAVAPSALENTSQIIQKCKLRISAAQRYHLNPKSLVLSAFGAEPSGQPPTQPTDLGSGNAFTPSSAYGVSMLRLDEPLVIPRNGTIEWALSAHSPWNGQGEGAVDENVLTSAWMLYQERGGLWPGSARARHVQLAAYTGNNLPTDECWPYAVDGFGAGTPTAPALLSPNWWPPQSAFPPNGAALDADGRRDTTFQAQESTRDGSTEITDLRVFIDQLSYDSGMDNSGGYNGLRPSQLAMRTGCRIRTASGGSNTWWWRPGAPVGLVFDYLSPANVYELPEPITVGRGEQLDVELEVPAQIEDPVPFQIGVSFNGFAAIEG